LQQYQAILLAPDTKVWGNFMRPKVMSPVEATTLWIAVLDWYMRLSSGRPLEFVSLPGQQVLAPQGSSVPSPQVFPPATLKVMLPLVSKMISM